MTTEAQQLDEEIVGGDETSATASLEEVGRRLRAAREAAGKTVLQVSEETRISVKYLEAMEKGSFEELPDHVFMVGFARNYSDYLKLPSDEIAAAVDEACSLFKRDLVSEGPRVLPERRFPAVFAIGISALLLLGLYYGWRHYTAVPEPVQGQESSGGPPADPGPPPAEPPAAEPATAEPAPASGPEPVRTRPTLFPITGAAPTTPRSAAPAPAPGAAEGSPFSLPAPGSPPPGALPGVGGGAPPAETAALPAPGVLPPGTAPGAGGGAPPAETAALPAPGVLPPGAGPESGDGAAPTETAALPAPGVLPPGAGPESGDGAAPGGTAAPPGSGAEAPSQALPGADGRAFGAEPPQSDVVIEVTSDSWIQVERQDGSNLISRILQPGDRYYVPRESGLRLRTGNAGGTVILLAGERLPPLGAPGEVVRNIPLAPEDLRARLQ